MTQSSQFLLICLMMIGGSPGSTAGGIKTTTFGVMVMTIFSIFRKRKNMEAFGRRMEDGVARSASCVFMMYLTLSLVAAMVISRVEGLPLLSALFECASAIGTVGLSFGITPTLGMLSKALLAGLMLLAGWDPSPSSWPLPPRKTKRPVNCPWKRFRLDNGRGMLQ